MIVGVPCYENHALTRQLVESLAKTVRDPAFTLVIVDNGSPTPYRKADFDVPFRLRVLRNERNEGNFWPLRQVADLEPGHDVVALMHNDVLIYERDWNHRVQMAFLQDRLLGMLGFAGGTAIGENGQRSRTVSNLRGERGHASALTLAGGSRITDLRPCVAVDGLFMAFRPRALPALTLRPSLPPAHFYDFIWSAEMQQAGWRVATLGIEIDHVGWSTRFRLQVELDAEWRRWCAEQGIEPGAVPMDAIYAAGERIWHDGFGSGQFWPCQIAQDWTVTR